MSSRGGTRDSLSVPKDKSRRGSSSGRPRRKSKKKKEKDGDEKSPSQTPDLTSEAGEGRLEAGEQQNTTEDNTTVDQQIHEEGNRTHAEADQDENVEEVVTSRPQSGASEMMRRREIDEIDERIELYREKYKCRQDLAVQWKKDVEDKRAHILEKYQKLKSLQSRKIDNFLEKSGLRKLLAFGKGNEMGESSCNTEGESHEAEMNREPEKSNVQIIIEPTEDAENKDPGESAADDGKKNRRGKSVSKDGSRKESRRHRRRGSVRSGKGDEDSPAIPQLGNTPSITPTKGH